MKNRKHHIPVYAVLSGIFLLLGIIYSLVGGFFGLHNMQTVNREVKTSATVVAIRDEAITVEYVTRDGERMQGEVDFHSSTMKVGTILSVYYDPNAPGDVHYVVGLQILTAVFLGIGVLALATGAILLTVWLHKRTEGKRLRQEGCRVLARVDSFREDRTIRVNRKHPVILLCTAQVQGQVREFRCRNFFANPERLVGRYAVVYYDPANPKKYTIEAPECPEMV